MTKGNGFMNIIVKTEANELLLEYVVDAIQLPATKRAVALERFERSERFSVLQPHILLISQNCTFTGQ
jgi:hypothetical protein